MVSVLARASYKWSVLIILLLGNGPKRFTEIRHGIGGITHKVLSQTLRTLKREGLIRRMPLHAGLARSDYELTCLGRSLRTAVQPLGAWAQAHVRDVSEARAEYDKRQRKEEQLAVANDKRVGS